MTDESIMPFGKYKGEKLANVPPEYLPETIFIQDLLPSHYVCEPREMGVHCKSDIGLTEAEEPYWNVIVTAIKLKYQERFMEIYHQTCTGHGEFTVYIRPKKTVMELFFGHK